MRTIPIYQALAEDIKAMGVDTVFGLMSDDTAAFAVTLDAMGIALIGARHENVAIGMADGYAAGDSFAGEDLTWDKPVKVFTMGENRWREYEDWPVPGAAPTSFYLASDAGANSIVTSESALTPIFPPA